MSRDEMSSGELMDLEARLRRAESAGEDDPGGDVLRKVQAHVNAHPAPGRGRPWGQRLSMFAVIGVPAAAAAAIAGVLLLNGHPLKAILPAPASSPSSAPQASPSGLPASPPPSATPTAVAPTSCRIPLSSADFGLNGPYVRGAFMTYPGGTIALDPASEVVIGSDGVSHMKNRPALRGNSSVPSYDLAAHQWLPVPFDAISPDGARYAWVDYPALRQTPPAPGPQGQPVHIVDVATGLDRIVHAADQFDSPSWDSPSTIYLVHHQAQTDSSQGLFRMDASSGAVTQVDSNGVDWHNVARGSAWGGRLNPADPQPPQGPVPANTAVRLDLASGSRTDWFYRPGKQVTVIGTDSAGHPLVSAAQQGQPSSQELWLLTSPGQGKQVALPANAAANQAWPDGSIVWVQLLPSPGPTFSIYRLEADLSMRRVAVTNAQPTGGCH